MLASQADAEAVKRAAARAASSVSSSLSDASDASDTDSSSDSDNSSSDSTSSAESRPAQKTVKGGPKGRPPGKSGVRPASKPQSERSNSVGPRRDASKGMGDVSPRTGVLFATNPPGKKRKPLSLQLINVQDRSGQTPIFRYCNHGDLDAVQQLIDAGADINIKDNGGWTPLHTASVNGHLEICSLLIKYGSDVNATSNVLDTPLHDASENGFVEVVQKLLQSGAYLNARNQKNQTALDVAADPEMVECLTKWEEMICKVNVADGEGRLPLHIAASCGDVSEIMTQVFYGASIRRRDNCGYSALHLAALFGHNQAVHHLLRLGADVDSANEDGDTPLLDAAINGHSKVVELLLKYGANKDLRNREGKAAVDETADQACRELLLRPRDSWKPFAEAEWMLRPLPGNDSEVEHRDLRSKNEVTGKGDGPLGSAADAHRHVPARPRAGSVVSESASSHMSGTAGNGTGSDNGRSAKGHHSHVREASQLGWGFAWFDAVKDVAVTREERKLQALMKIIEKQEGKPLGPPGSEPADAANKGTSDAGKHEKDRRTSEHESNENNEPQPPQQPKPKKHKKEKKEKKERKEKEKKPDDPETPKKKRGRPPKNRPPVPVSGATGSPGVSPETLRIRREEEEQLEILKRELQEVEEKQRSSREGSYDFDEWGSHKKKKGSKPHKEKKEKRDGGGSGPSSSVKRGPGRPRKIREDSSPVIKDEPASDELGTQGIKREREGKGGENAAKRRRRSLSPVIESAPAPRRGARKLDALASLFGDNGSSAEDDIEPERIRSPMLDALLEQARGSGDLQQAQDIVMEDVVAANDQHSEDRDERMRTSRDPSPEPLPAAVKEKKMAAADKVEKVVKNSKASKPEKMSTMAPPASAAKKPAVVPPKPKPRLPPMPLKTTAPPPPPAEPVVIVRAKKKKVSLLGQQGETVEEPQTPVAVTPSATGVESLAVAALLNQAGAAPMDVDRPAVPPSVTLAPSTTHRLSIPDVAMKPSIDAVQIGGPITSAVVPSSVSAAAAPPAIYIPKISMDEATALAALTALHDTTVASTSGGSPNPLHRPGSSASNSLPDVPRAFGSPGLPNVPSHTPPLTNQPASSSSNVSAGIAEEVRARIGEIRAVVEAAPPTTASASANQPLSGPPPQPPAVAAGAPAPPTSAGGYVHKLKRLPPNKRFDESAVAK